MTEHKYQLDLFPIVVNRSIVNLYSKQIFIDWLKYIDEGDFSTVPKHIEPISFLIKDFSTLFEIRLSYSCVDKTVWPEIRT
jgi:hypothetical protein